MPSDDDDEPIRPKKKKKKRIAIEDEDRGDSKWWIVPVALIVAGLVMSLIGSIGFFTGAKNSKESVGVAVVLVGTLVQFLISIPINVGALFVGGKILGIEYGTPMQAFLGIAAIGSMMMGLDWLLTWLGLWRMAVLLITFVAGFSLFMTLFQLDTWEVWASIICIKILTFLSYIAMIAILIGAANASS
jgi:hypothetical protein